MIASFFLGLIMLSHPGRLPTVVSSDPMSTMEECEADVLNKGIPFVVNNYVPLGWVVENAYCVPISEENGLKLKYTPSSESKETI